MCAKIAETNDNEEAASILKDIEAQETELQSLFLAVNNAKLALKMAREEYEEGVDHLRQLARTRLGENPLFDPQEDDDE